ncbi:hypothetical protein DIPPA_15703 [Diplonema papillatum]|nr:hypothetical protein DIPPA_15703 [Diplonema papillatum]
MRAAAVSLSRATRLALRRRAGGSPCLSLRRCSGKATPPEAPGAVRSAGENDDGPKGEANSLVGGLEEKEIIQHPSKEELWEKYGVLSNMDSRHDHLTTQEFVQLWWKLQELNKAGTTLDMQDIHTTQMQKDNWELTYQLLVHRLPPKVQALYEETFNQKYLTFRPPKLRAVGMPPPQDYLDVWQAEQPTFYIRESWPNGLTYFLREQFWGSLRSVGVPVGLPRAGCAKIQLSHPMTADIPDLHEAYRAKLVPGQVGKLLPADGSEPPPLRRRRFLLFRRNVGNTPNYLSLPWIEVVDFRSAPAEPADGEPQQVLREVQVKVFKGQTRDLTPEGRLVASTDFELQWVASDRLVMGSDRLDYVSLAEPLAEGESRDIIRFLWPAPLVEDEDVKFLYAQEGYEYPFQNPHEPTLANDLTADALMLPYEFVSKREPDIPNTLGKIAVVVGSREYPLMVDFWDALARFNLAHRNIQRKVAQWGVAIGLYDFIFPILRVVLAATAAVATGVAVVVAAAAAAVAAAAAAEAAETTVTETVAAAAALVAAAHAAAVAAADAAGIAAAAAVAVAA